MAFQPSTINNMQLAYAPDGTVAYTNLLPPASSRTTAYNQQDNLNGGTRGGGVDPGDSNYALVTAGTDVVKRRRGRPRKNPIDGSRPLAAAAQSGAFSPLGPNLVKRPRGRPPGSTKKIQPVASGSPAGGFMVHILDVKAGEDILKKLVWASSQNSTRALCILSATGVISKVRLEQRATIGGTVTYEGRFEMLSLSGTFRVPENDNQRSRICGLTVVLAGPDGYALGGNVAGVLTAASPVQVFFGSFDPSSRKRSKERGSSEAEVVNAPANPVSGSMSESSSRVPWSPVGQSSNSYPQDIVDMLWRQV
ncbi:putative AT-hook motif nuclear-localized protein [Helianthus annuus]|uniref:AT-hook motif nuclear-localized protein 10 n=1 Tax=Helianthus annuus TaxID=4232 RepID=UPI001652FF1E|nr:AT-hook motif nuclear-localized protein 10 [Helianthus annuus]KAJ0907864.1 putative AT-hook motif nuclear-localized protein [Helianthus annuus]